MGLHLADLFRGIGRDLFLAWTTKSEYESVPVVSGSRVGEYDPTRHVLFRFAIDANPCLERLPHGDPHRGFQAGQTDDRHAIVRRVVICRIGICRWIAIIRRLPVFRRIRFARIFHLRVRGGLEIRVRLHL